LNSAAHLSVLQPDNAGGEEGGVFRARSPDRKRADGHPGRHLRNREQRIESFKRARLDRNPENRQPCLSRNHTRQMGCAARAGDNHLHATVRRFLGEPRHQIRGAMSRDNPVLGRHTELPEHLDAMLHRLPIRGAPHDDTDRRSLLFRHRNQRLIPSPGAGKLQSVFLEVAAGWNLSTRFLLRRGGAAARFQEEGRGAGRA
jgi:hypothetical protein